VQAPVAVDEEEVGYEAPGGGAAEQGEDDGRLAEGEETRLVRLVDLRLPELAVQQLERGEGKEGQSGHRSRGRVAAV